jgi:DNA-binding MarR family transcriptional regulator
MEDIERDARLRDFVERLGMFFEQVGGSPMMGRILGWLLVCEPSHQSSTELAEALGASKASISTSSRQLLALGLIERVPVPGARGAWFRLTPDAWAVHLQRDLMALTMFRELLDSGIGAMRDEPAPRAARLQEARALFVFFEGEYPLIIQRFKALQSTGGAS